MLDLNQTHVLVEAQKQIPLEVSFLTDRYAPTNLANDVFATEQVIIDVMDGENIAAPFVVPKIGGVAITRKGFKTEMYKPGNIDIHTPLTYDDLNRRTFGEQFNTLLTPEQRQDALVMQDMSNLKKAIRNRRELMVGEVLTSNALVMKHVDKSGELIKEEILQFYDTNNKAMYIPTIKWNEEGADIFGDLKVMVRTLRSKGVACTDLIVGPEVADIITADPQIQKLLDNRRYNLGEVTQEVYGNNVSVICKLVVDGTVLTVFCYDATFIDLTNKEEKRVIPEGYIVVTAPNSCKTKFGAVTLLEDDKNFHTYAEPYVASVDINKTYHIRDLHMYSNPLVHPTNIVSFMFADVLG